MYWWFCYINKVSELKLRSNYHIICKLNRKTYIFGKKILTIFAFNINSKNWLQPEPKRLKNTALQYIGIHSFHTFRAKFFMKTDAPIFSQNCQLWSLNITRWKSDKKCHLLFEWHLLATQQNCSQNTSFKGIWISYCNLKL